MRGMGMASPSYSLSTPAMIFRMVDLPEPFTPSTPILAPGKKDSEMSLRMCRLGGTVLLTRFIEKTYCAMASFLGIAGVVRSCGGAESPAAPRAGEAPNGYCRSFGRRRRPGRRRGTDQ